MIVESYSSVAAVILGVPPPATAPAVPEPKPARYLVAVERVAGDVVQLIPSYSSIEVTRLGDDPPAIIACVCAPKQDKADLPSVKEFPLVQLYPLYSSVAALLTGVPTLPPTAKAKS